MFDLCCDSGVMFMVNRWKRCVEKLRSTILFQFELITFRFGYMRTLKLFISMISGLSDVSPSPKNIYFYLWPRVLLKMQENPNPFWGEIWDLEMLKRLEVRFPHTWKAGSYFWWFWNFETLKLWRFEALKLVIFWNFDTKKLWNQETKKLCQVREIPSTPQHTK